MKNLIFLVTILVFSCSQDEAIVDYAQIDGQNVVHKIDSPISSKNLVHEIDYEKYPLLSDGIEYIHDKKYKKAIHILNKAEMEYGISTDIYMNRSACYFQLKDYESSISDLTKAIEINSDYMALFINRGLSYSYNKEFELAERDLNKAKKAFPKEPLVYINTASMHFQRGGTELGCLNLNKAIQLGYREKYKTNMADQMLDKFCKN